MTTPAKREGAATTTTVMATSIEGTMSVTEGDTTSTTMTTTTTESRTIVLAGAMCDNYVNHRQRTPHNNPQGADHHR